MDIKIEKRWMSFLVILTLITGLFAGTVVSEKTAQASSTGLIYASYLQKVGWLNPAYTNECSGRAGYSLRVEAFKLCLTDQEYSGSVVYRSYCQSYGWRNWAKDGEVSGTTGQGKRMEAIQIKLTGDIANYYDIFYTAYVQSYGWLGWAKNGETAGTAEYGKRIEAIQIDLLPKDKYSANNTIKPYLHPLVKYRTHVQKNGWQNYVSDGAVAGTSGQAKRLEAINISLVAQEYSGGISYKTHVQKDGWQNWKSNGQMSGTSGQAKRLEAIQIKLTGEMANHYDIYYRVHAQKFGWMGWAKNGASAGTEGYAYRLEALQIKLVEKGGAAPGSTSNAFQKKAGPKTISNVQELLAIDGKSGSYVLTRDIDMSGCNQIISKFSGTLDGRGHSLIGQQTVLVKENVGTIKNINFKNVNINRRIEYHYYQLEDPQSGGAAVAFTNNGTISDCTVTGNIYIRADSVDNATYAAGFVLYNGGTLNRCFNYATVTSDGSHPGSWGFDNRVNKAVASGICISNEGTIKRCQNAGNRGIHQAQRRYGARTCPPGKGRKRL